MAKKVFTKEELDNIIKDYNNGNGLRPFELGKKYNRNASSISNKLKDLGIYKYTIYNNDWSKRALLLNAARYATVWTHAIILHKRNVREMVAGNQTS